MFSVQDNGVGVGAAECEEIFGAFQRGCTSRGQEGTGLGRAIVRQIALRHGGQAWAESGPESGVTFHISLGRIFSLSPRYCPEKLVPKLRLGTL